MALQGERMNKELKARNSNIEFLRIVAMILIVIHHLVYHGGILNDVRNCNVLLGSILFPGGKMGFVLFVLISSWYSTEGNFKSESFLRLWLQVLFYNVLVNTLSVIASHGEISYRVILGGFFPIMGNSHGFAVAFLLFLIILPILQAVGSRLSKRNVLSYIILIFMIQFGEPLILKASNSSIYVDIIDEIQVFILIWLVAFAMKRFYWDIILRIRSYDFGVLFILTWVLMSALCYIKFTNPDSRLLAIMFYKLSNENSPVVILSACFLFISVIRCMPSFNRAVNDIAACTFGVLLIHDNNFFRSILWKKIICVPMWMDNEWYVVLLKICFYSLLVFCVCVLVDKGRQVAESKLRTTGVFRFISSMADGMFGIK